jgi:Flp pilus assembly pilin Flp
LRQENNIDESNMKSFIKSECGGTAVEYALLVVLISAASLGAVATSGDRLRQTFDTIVSALPFSAQQNADRAWRELVSIDFSSGTGGWGCVGSNCPENLRTDQFGDWGWMLGPHGREFWPNNWLSFPINLSENAVAAIIEFDLFIMDSWDGVGTRFSRGGINGNEGDAIRFRIDNTTFSTQQFIHAANPVLLGGEPSNIFRADSVDFNRSLLDPIRQQSGTIGGSEFSLNMTLVERGNDPLRQHSASSTNSWEDQRWRVAIEIQNPEQNFDFRMMPTIDQVLSDESFGISNFSIRER